LIVWELLFSTSEKQGLNGICADGLQVYSEKGETIPGFNAPELYKHKMAWLGNVLNMENTFARYELAIRHLSEFSKQSGIPIMILKGYGCSLNYPQKNHRVCGDIDIYCFGRQEEFDRMIKEKRGIKIKPGNSHHSSFNFDGFFVENHKTILDPDAHSENKGLNLILTEEAKASCPDKDLQVFFPSVKFNSIHLLSHMASDFASTGTTLRRLLDWSTFVYANSHDGKEKIDWDYVFNVAEKFGMVPFLNSINDICIRYLGYPQEYFPVRNSNPALSDKVLEDLLKDPEDVLMPSETNILKYGITKSRSFIQNSWKYKMVYRDSLVMSFIKKSLNRFFGLKKIKS